MKALALAAGVLVGAFVLLAMGFSFGAAVFFAAADNRTARRSAQEEAS